MKKFAAVFISLMLFTAVARSISGTVDTPPVMVWVDLGGTTQAPFVPR